MAGPGRASRLNLPATRRLFGGAAEARVVRLRHRPADADADADRSPVLAARVDVADSLWRKGLGLMFRRSVPSDYALAFRFDAPATRRLHMLAVPFDVDAVWAVDGRVERVARLDAWTGRGAARADLVVELPAGAADPVAPGDRIALEADAPDG